MKNNNNKILIVLAVICLNVLVVFMIGQNLLGKDSEYDIKLAEARGYAEAELCSKAIEAYEQALVMEDSLDIRLEMIGVYEKGMSTGEFANVHTVIREVREILEDYPRDVAAYEMVCEFLYRYGKYEECAEALMQARDLTISSDKLSALTEDVRYLYDMYYGRYDSVMPFCDGYVVVVANDKYSLLDRNGKTHSEGVYSYISSYSEGYAFAKAEYSDGTERSFLIDENEQRQVYFEGVETSSGVGAAKNSEGVSVLLLACKVGDKYTYYNTDGTAAFGEYAFAGRFRNNVAAVMESEGVWKLIDGTGKAIVDTTFTDIVLNEFDECAPKGLIIANNGGGYRLYNHKGAQIGSFTCDGARAFVDGYAAFKLGEKWGFVDAQGNVVIEARYDDVRSFSCGIGAVKLADAWGFVNSSGKLVIDAIFDDVSYLSNNGICFVKKGTHWSNMEFYYTDK